MLEAGFDQAHGLQALELRPPTRVLPVVASAEGERSLELLWRLEQGLRALGLPVLVQEGARGLRVADAEAGHRAVLRRWLDGVPPGGVVLLHAPLDALTALLADSPARPLVALTDAPKALVGAYNAVKVLHQAAALQPIVLRLEGGTDAPPEPEASTRLAQAEQALRTTCQQRLGWVPVVWPLGYHPSSNRASAGRLAESGWLKLLDSALMIEESETRAHDDTCRQRCPIPADQTLGVPDVHRQRHA